MTLAARGPPPPGKKKPAMADWVSAYRFMRHRMGFLRALSRQGDLVPFQLGPQPAYLVTAPELVREILVVQEGRFHKGRALQNAKRILGEGLLTSEGEKHRRQRKLIQPVFHRQRVLRFGDPMLEETDRHVAGWRAGQRLRLEHEMNALTLSIVGRTLFQTDVEKDKVEVREALERARRFFDVALAPFGGQLEKIFPPLRRRVQKVRDQLDTVIYRMIEDHRAHPRDDLLTLLLEAQEQDGRDDVQVRDEALTLFLAGHETTAINLAWTLWLLAAHPELQQRLRAEVGNETLTAASYGRLPFTEAVVLESLRLYPPAWILGRLCVEPVQLGPVQVRAQELVLTSPWLTQHDPRWFDRPLTFSPERWLVTPRSALPKGVYFPFGGGSRVCIGEHFALMEAILITARLVQRFQLLPVFGQSVGLDAGITLRPTPALYVDVAPV